MISPYELILKKKLNKKHTSKEIQYIVNSYLNGEFTDYQMTAWLMSVYFNGMNESEVNDYTNAIINSGSTLEWYDLDGFVVDKHSIGGVGDKVSISLAPILAACGCFVPMIVGRALGHTGGTLDKLESIPGYNAMINLEKFKEVVKSTGCSIIGQIPEICPADLKIYNLRDQTSTIDSNPLICGSIMSKKIAEGISGLILDVKVGNGSFMKSMPDAKKLSKSLEMIAKNFNIKVGTVFSDMNQVLGNSAGLYCEILESINILKGEGPKDLESLVKEIAVRCLELAEVDNPIQKIDLAINSGAAYEIFLQMVYNHGGKLTSKNISSFNQPKYIKAVIAEKSGYLQSMDTFSIGMNLIEIGAGRKTINDSVDYTAGITLKNKLGDKLNVGDEIAIIYNSVSEKLLNDFNSSFVNCFKISHENKFDNDYKLILN